MAQSALAAEIVWRAFLWLSRLLGVMLLSAVYLRLKKLISLVCYEGRRCTQRSWSSSAKDTTGMHRVWYTGNRYICLGQGVSLTSRKSTELWERDGWLEGKLQACTQN